MTSNLGQFRLLLHAAGSAGCVVILAVCYFLGLLPLQSSEKELTRRREVIRKFIQTRPAVEARHQKLRAQVDRTQRDIDRLADRIPETTGEDRLLRDFSRLAARANAKLMDFQPGISQPLGNLHMTDVRLTVRGGYEGMCRFLAGLRNSRRLQRITNVDLRVSSRLKGEYEATIRIDVYFKENSRAANAQG